VSGAGEPEQNGIKLVQAHTDTIGKSEKRAKGRVEKPLACPFCINNIDLLGSAAFCGS